MKIAVMQPYFFPYIGYFQLINEVDKFVFFDDVQFINKGWINRNRILVNEKPNYLTVSLNKASQNKEIKQICIIDNRDELLKKIEFAYKKAPQFKIAFPVIEDVLKFNTSKISELSMYSVTAITKYLGLNTIFTLSSLEFADTKEDGRTERIISICKKSDANTYINPIGGTDLYSRKEFHDHQVTLKFINPQKIEYKQFKNIFVSNLSIIDVIMFNSVKESQKLLSKYSLC
jgi:hypothetical protein